MPPLFIILCTLFTLSLAAAAAAAAPNPAPNPSAVVRLDAHTRLTVLTPTLVRIESGPGDDRATLAVVNRALPVPPFTVTPDSRGVVIATAALSVNFTLGGPPGGACAAPRGGTDAEGAVRSPSYPHGLPNATLAACCAACGRDPQCVAWAFAEDTRVCFPLAAFAGTRGAANRSFGEWRAPSVAISSAGPSGAPFVWTPRRGREAGNLNGTYFSLDSSSRADEGPMGAIAEYGARMQPGLLSASGFGVLDDTAGARTEPHAGAPTGAWLADAPGADSLDLYFQAHGGLDYRGALREWAAVLGAPALLPRAALGPMWSLYFAFNQSFFVNSVLGGYKNFSIPLSTVVLDDDVSAAAPAPVHPPPPIPRARAPAHLSSLRALPPACSGTSSPPTGRAPGGATTTPTRPTGPTWRALRSPCTRTATSRAPRCGCP